MKEIVIVIPARMKGTRLPGKPLIEIMGKTILQRVYDRCLEVLESENIYVATEDLEIEVYCNSNKIKVINTGYAESALDRIKLFSDIVSAKFYINVQGDEPLVNPNDIKKIIKETKKNINGVIIGKTKCNEKEFRDFSKAKVVCNKFGRLLYSSRAGIPLTPKGNYQNAERAIWVYGLQKEYLDDYYNGKDLCVLDKIEDNEILRFLELNINVFCIDLIGNSWAVDEPKDLNIIENLIKNGENSGN
jgi:3-deoxy-manno-octulosonate cytidylyltransferase (CMP-KDO synthetase)